MNPRAELIAHFFTAATRALDAGDLEGARIAHEAAGKLLAGPAVASPVKPDALPLADALDAREGQRGTGVVDLAHERGKRGRS